MTEGSERAQYKLGIIGGSGLYRLQGIEAATEHRVSTPYGLPSDALVTGSLRGQDVVFLSRHGRGHLLSPTDLPYRANIYALKAMGVTHILSVSAVGSLKAEIEPRHVVVPDQIIDRTHLRTNSFFEAGAVAHVGIADPYCHNFRQAVLHAAGGTGAVVHDGGILLTIEGPQFSTRAESFLYRSWGASIIGMTAMPEARLAREAELAYATLALVTDYDVWHETEEDVSVELVEGNLAAGITTAQEVIAHLVELGLPEPDEQTRNALHGALTSDMTMMPADVRRKLGIILDRYVPPAE
jgi:5'-methylthioadenosine phosphorylase